MLLTTFRAISFLLILTTQVSANEDNNPDKWDLMLQNMTITPSTQSTDEASDESTGRDKNIRSNYTGLAKPVAPSKGTQGQNIRYQTATAAAADEAVEVEMQLMTEDLGDLMPKPIKVLVPEKPKGLKMVFLSKGNTYNGFTHDNLLLTLNIRDITHTNYIAAYLSNRSSEGWSWEQEITKQKPNLTNSTITEMKISLKKPANN